MQVRYDHPLTAKAVEHFGTLARAVAEQPCRRTSRTYRVGGAMHVILRNVRGRLAQYAARKDGSLVQYWPVAE